MLRSFLLPVALMLLAASAILRGDEPADPPRPTPFNAAPLWQVEANGELTMRRALGPIFECARTASGQSLFAIRPFYSRAEDANLGIVETNFLWPIWFTRQLPEQTSRHGLAVFYRDLHVFSPTERRSIWLLPFWFQGKTDTGDSYFALFPLGGNIQDFFGYDDIWFWTFPAYATVRRGETRSLHVLWPIYADVHGPNLDKRRVFPFYGYAREAEGWEKRFALWPIFVWGHPVHPERQGSSFTIFPLYGHIEYDNPTRRRFLTNTTVLWPFFHSLHTQQGRRLFLPWPFIQIQDDLPQVGDRRRYVWPFWGNDVRGTINDTFYLWPLIRHQVTQGETGETDRWFFLPFTWSFNDRNNDGTEASFRQIWPLCTYGRDAQGATFFRTLDLWPMREHHAVERNYAPFWRIYEYKRQAERRQHDLLWGLYQYRAKEEQVERHALFPLFSYRDDERGKGWTALTGLLGRQSVDGKRRTRLLWFFTFDAPARRQVKP